MSERHEDTQPVAVPDEAYVRQAVHSIFASPSFDYHFQIIVPLSNDPVVKLSAVRLFGKRPSGSVLAMTDRVGSVNDVLGWTPAGEGSYRHLVLSKLAEAFPAVPAVVGRVRIVLVGHGDDDFRHLARLYERIGGVVDVVLRMSNLQHALLSLVGCQVFEPQHSLRSGRAGRIARWMMERADEIRGPRGRECVAVRARSFVMKVWADGKKRSFLRLDGERNGNDVYVSKESAEHLGVLYKSELKWDPLRQRITLAQASMRQFVNSIVEFEPVVRNEAESDDGGALQGLRRELIDGYRACLAGPDAVVPSNVHRDNLDALVRRGAKAVTLFARWRRAVERLAPESVPHHWLHIPEDVRLDGAGYELGFRSTDSAGRLDAALMRWTRTNDSVFVDMRTRTRQLIHDMTPSLVLGTDGQWMLRQQATHAQRLTTLNAAFILYVLLTHDQSPTGKAYSRAIAIQVYSGMAGHVMSVGHTATHSMEAIYALAGRRSAMLEAVAKASQKFGMFISHILDALTLYGAVQELLEAKAVAARAAATTRIATTALMASMNIGRWFSGRLAGVALGELLDAMMVPLVGLSIGLESVVRNYGDLNERATDALRQLQATADAVATDVWSIDKGVLSVREGAVVTSLDTITRRIGLGNVSLRAMEQGHSHTHLGHWAYYASLPVANGDPISLYDALDVRASRARPWGPSTGQVLTTVRLPHEPSYVYGYAYVQAPGARWREGNLSVTQRLEAQYPGRFCWAMYVFPTDYAIADLKAVYLATTLTAVVDTSDIRVVVPDVTDTIKRSRLNYRVETSDSLALELPASAVALTIVIAAPDRGWIWIDATRALHASPVDTGEKGAIGEVVEHAFLSVSSAIANVSVGQQNVAFSPRAPEQLTLVSRFENIAELTLSWMARRDKSVGKLSGQWMLVFEDSTRLDARLLDFVAELRRGGISAVIMPAMLLGAERPYEGYIHLGTGDAVLAAQRADLDCTDIRVNGVSLRAPGACNVGLSDDALRPFVVSGRIKDKLTYTIPVGESSLRVSNAFLEPEWVDRAVDGALPWKTLIGPFASLFADARAQGKDSQNRFVRFQSTIYGLATQEIEWTELSVTYRYTKETLQVWCTNISSQPVFKLLKEPIEQIHITGLANAGTVDLSVALSKAAEVSFDATGLHEALTVTLANQLVPEALLVEAEDLAIPQGAAHRLVLRGVFGRARAGAYRRIYIGWAGQLRPLTDLLRTLPVTAGTRPTSNSRYLGTNQSGVHYFVDVPPTVSESTPVRVYEQDGLEIIPNDLRGVEPLAADQPAVVDRGFLKGASGQLYRVDKQNVEKVEAPSFLVVPTLRSRGTALLGSS